MTTKLKLFSIKKSQLTSTHMVLFMKTNKEISFANTVQMNAQPVKWLHVPIIFTTRVQQEDHSGSGLIATNITLVDSKKTHSHHQHIVFNQLPKINCNHWMKPHLKIVLMDQSDYKYSKLTEIYNINYSLISVTFHTLLLMVNTLKEKKLTQDFHSWRNSVNLEPD